MSEYKRNRRFRRNREEKRPIVLAKRGEESGNVSSSRYVDVQPKILVKPRPNIEQGKEYAGPNNQSGNVTGKTLIVSRSEASRSPATLQDDEDNNQEQGFEASNVTSSRPITVVLSTGALNVNSKKLTNKSNTEFFVIGVLGTQGVGKSTIMNLLANEDPHCDYYKKVFVDEENLFPTKLKKHKSSTRSRTESTHIYFTSDRIILLDSPPLLCNSYRKYATVNELDDLRCILLLLSVCHLVIIVQDDYFNMNLIRLIQLAELMKPVHENQLFASNYSPNLLFIKNRGKRSDFTQNYKAKMDNMLKVLFRNSELKIFVGQSSESSRHKKELQINSFIFPEIDGPNCKSYHKSLKETVEELQSLVFRTHRGQMHAGNGDFTESSWFELLKSVVNEDNYLFHLYEETHTRHFKSRTGNNETNRRDRERGDKSRDSKYSSPNPTNYYGNSKDVGGDGVNDKQYSSKQHLERNDYVLQNKDGHGDNDHAREYHSDDHDANDDSDGALLSPSRSISQSSDVVDDIEVTDVANENT